MEKVARRKDIYRPHFCEGTFYQNHLSDFSKINHAIQHLNLKQQMTIWIICCSCLRRPTTWFSGRQALQSLPDDAGPTYLYNLFQELKIAWPKSLPADISVYEFCRTVRISPLPKAAQSALYYFYTDKYPLEILPFEPEPLELLKLQIKGKRVLTFEANYSLWPTLKYGERDVLSFWLHDLIHAEHFLSDSKKLRGQIGFYFFVYEIMNQKLLEPLLVSHEFYRDFSYLISDMNSHPVHLIKTLKALICIYNQIHETTDNAENIVWKRIMQLPILSSNSEMQQIFEKLNTSNFTDIHAIKLTDFFQQDLYHLTLS